MIELNLKQGYLAMFYLLDEYYWKPTQDDSLAMILSSLSPFIFIDCMSADPACWQEWQETAKKITNKDFMTVDDVLKTSIAFLKLYSNDFYKIEWLIVELEKLSPESDILKIYVNKAIKEKDSRVI